MTKEHPITPPPDLLKHWEDQHFDEGENYDVMLIQAYQVGADQELEACCEYLTRCAAWEPEDVKEFCDLRRPKPPSLKAQALEAVDALEGFKGVDIIRRALESLPD